MPLIEEKPTEGSDDVSTDALARMDLHDGPYEFTACGLQMSGTSTTQQWETCGEALRRVDEARQWAIGDWLRDGKQHYGDGLYRRAAQITGLSEGTLRNLKSLADCFQMSLRSDKLGWHHHQVVSSLSLTTENGDGTLCVSDEPDRDAITALLQKAERQGVSVVELRDAVRQHKEQQREHIRLANEPEKYSVVYADPPWFYSGDQGKPLSEHYPSMPLSDICALPVERMASTDAVLFLWATVPLLPDALKVVEAWGFTYKSLMVWDKVAHNVGNYVSMRCELLLIATRGQPPKVPHLVDSVYVEERTEHSRKPAHFRELIDELYPSGNRIEMFARGAAVDGWRVWGSEASE